MKNRSDRAIRRFGIAMCLLIGGCPFLWFLSKIIRPNEARPTGSTFQLKTGIAFEEGWEVVDSGAHHSGFGGDGETYIILLLPQDAIERLLGNRPPWSAEWQSGPIPVEIGFHCQFGTNGLGYDSVNGEKKEYFGNPALVQLLGSSSVFYDARERCCKNLRWHNGDLLIIDPTTRKVWLSVWDF